MKHSISQIINEEIKKYTKFIINEGVETKNMAAAKHYLYERSGMDEDDAMRTIGSIKTQIPNSRLAKCKYMLAMVRMLTNNELKDDAVKMEVNKALRYAASDAHIQEYDRDLNGMSAQDLINRFKSFSDNETQQDREALNRQRFNKERSNYDIIKIHSFEESSKYGRYVDWCVTHDETMWNSYTANGIRPFYFCLRKDFKEVEDIQTENCPLDNYGLSMIAVSVNPDGSPSTITCRWNHENGGDDTVMTTEQLSRVINMNFYDTFLPNTPEEIEAIKRQTREKIKSEIVEYLNGQTLDEYDEDGYGFENFELIEGTGDVKRFCFYSDTIDQYVLVDEDANMVCDEPFTSIHTMAVSDKNKGITAIIVSTDDGYNLIDLNGNKLLQTNYGYMCIMFCKTNKTANTVPFVIVRRRINGDWKQNIIDLDGNLLLSKWYEKVTNLMYGKYGVIVSEEDSTGDIITKTIDIRTEETIFDGNIAYEPLFKNVNAVQVRGEKFFGAEPYQLYDDEGKLVAPWLLAHRPQKDSKITFRDQGSDDVQIGYFFVYVRDKSGRLINGARPLILDSQLNLHKIFDGSVSFEQNNNSFHSNYVTEPFMQNQPNEQNQQ